MSVWVGLHLHESGGWAGSCLVGLCPVVSDFVQSGRAMSGWYGSPTTDDSVIVEDLVLVDELVTVVDKRPVEVGIVALWVGATCCLDLQTCSSGRHELAKFWLRQVATEGCE